jgi:hypothetical protein
MKIQHHLQKERVHTSKCLKYMLERQALASSNVAHVNYHQKGFMSVTNEQSLVLHFLF